MFLVGNQRTQWKPTQTQREHYSTRSSGSNSAARDCKLAMLLKAPTDITLLSFSYHFISSLSLCHKRQTEKEKKKKKIKRHTSNPYKLNTKKAARYYQAVRVYTQLFFTLTVSVLERLLLFGRLRDDLDALAEEDADVGAVAVQHAHRQHEVLALV